MQNHKSQQLQLVVGSLWPGVMVLVVGRMDQNMNLTNQPFYIEASISLWIIVTAGTQQIHRSSSIV